MEEAGRGPGPGSDPTRWRVSDRERHEVAELLREAAGEGRIDLAELEERLEATYAARTYADLAPLTADLPRATGGSPPVLRPPADAVPGPPRGVPVGTPGGAAVPLPTYPGSFALMAETRRAGVWQTGESHWAFALMGSVVIDLRHVRFGAPELTLTANALMGGVEVIVNPFTHVLVEGVGVMGSYSEGRPEVAPQVGPHSPVVRVRGIALMGGVEVKRRA